MATARLFRSTGQDQVQPDTRLAQSDALSADEFHPRVHLGKDLKAGDSLTVTEKPYEHSVYRAFAASTFGAPACNYTFGTLFKSSAVNRNVQACPGRWHGQDDDSSAPGAAGTPLQPEAKATSSAAKKSSRSCHSTWSVSSSRQNTAVTTVRVRGICRRCQHDLVQPTRWGKEGPNSRRLEDF